MNDDYKAALLIHNSQQDLIWWDQNYGIVFIFTLDLISFLIV